MDTPEINFTVFNREGFFDPYTLYVADNSYWLHLEDKPSIIEVQTPGSKGVVVNYFDKFKINNLNSIALNLSCPDCNDFELRELPDGVYNITVKGSPSTFSHNKKHLRTTKARMELAKYLISLNIGCSTGDNKHLISKIMEVNLLLDSAEANIVYDNIQAANDEYQLARRKLQEISNCKNCW